MAAATCGQGGPCTVFATSTLSNGNLGGLSGADAICNQRATEANLPGTYLAWLSDATNSPSTRFPTQSAGPYVRVDGTQVARDWADLTSGLIRSAIDRTELGAYVQSDREAWTNTSPDGTPSATSDGETCTGWTSNSPSLSGSVGETDEVDADWTDSHSDPCDLPWRLYCFQQS